MALARVMLVVLLGLGSAFQGGALVRPTRSRARPSTRPPELPRSSLARSRRFAGARRALDAPARTPLRLEASEGTPDGWVCDAWLGNLVSVPRSLILRRIAGHLLFNVAVAAAFVPAAAPKSPFSAVVASTE